jgi:hypothetical protein
MTVDSDSRARGGANPMRPASRSGARGGPARMRLKQPEKDAPCSRDMPSVCRAAHCFLQDGTLPRYANRSISVLRRSVVSM